VQRESPDGPGCGLGRREIVGQLYAVADGDGTKSIPTSSDRNGKPLATHQQRLDRWHLEMAQKYRNAARRPWLEPAVDTPPGATNPD